MSRPGCLAVLFITLCTSPVVGAQALGASPPTSRPDDEASAVELQGSELFLAQVVAMFGAESMLTPLALCPATAWGASLISPGLGVLALDWVGREMGHVAGSQVAAMLASYGLGCGGSLVAGTGLVLFSAPAYIGVLMLAGGSAAAGGLLLLSLPGAALCGLGLATIAARPFIVPWVWSSFAPDDPNVTGRPPTADRRGTSKGVAY